MATGLLDYFPAALAEVARVSKVANDQHNPGQPMHWSRGKSTDHADTMLRHLVDRGTLDKDNLRHSAKVAWRALALLQEEMEAEGAPMSRASRVDAPTPKPQRVRTQSYDPNCQIGRTCNVCYTDAEPGQPIRLDDWQQAAAIPE